MNRKKVVLMLSGGRYSFLSACRLLDDPSDYYLIMVTYDNGCTYYSDSAKYVADRIITKYGNDRAEYLGVIQICSVIREFFSPYFNMKPEDQAKAFYGMTPSQFHCLVCRTSMYLYSIWIAMTKGASYIAEGARKDTELVVELPGMAKERYPALVKMAELELLLPVYELNDDWSRDNELLSRGYLPKVIEPKCLIRFPVNNCVDESVINGVHAYYDKVMFPRIKENNFILMEKAKTYLCCSYNELF